MPSRELKSSTGQPEPADPASEPTRIVGGASALETGGVLTVDLAAIRANWRQLASRAAPAECAAVVKADAYGCGLEPVVTALAASGCKTFFVADLAEGRHVRAIAPEATVYALNGIAPGSASAFADAYVRPVIGSLVELAEWDAFCSASGWHGGAALHFDTGMNRLGLSVDEGVALAPRAKMLDHGITLVMSHFACADTPDNPLNSEQIQVFRELRLMFRGVTASLANSAGIFLGASAHCDLVRPGIALYGANPTPGQANPMTPVVELKGRITLTRNVAKGATIGYGAAWTATRVSRIAVVSVGYADGYPRAAGHADGHPGAEAIVSGRRCRVAGRISMDLLALDVTDLPDHAAKRGDHVTLIGDTIDVDEFASAVGTISYEVLVNLGRRCHRVWTG
jgi:alanine racemase